MTDFKPSYCAILCTDNAARTRAEQLSRCLKLPVVSAPQANTVNYLVVTTQYLGLRCLDVAKTDLIVDFVGGRTGYRHRKGEGKKQPLAKAVGIKPGYLPSVLDLTAGLGRDAFVLAGLGCEVNLVERSPFIFVVLQDGLERAKDEASVRETVERMQCLQAQALDYLNDIGTRLPDVIYLDPMYPHRDKTALVKKEMRIIRAFVGDDDDIATIVSLARLKAGKRVVVKRPKHAEPVINEPANFIVESKNTRYDVYLPIS